MDPEAKHRLLDGIKAKAAMSATEMTKSLEFRIQAMVFASCSSGNKSFTVKEEVGFNFKKTFRKPNKKIMANKSNNMCTRFRGRPHYCRPCHVLSKSGKVGHFSKMCRSKVQTNSGMYDLKIIFCE